MSRPSGSPALTGRLRAGALALALGVLSACGGGDDGAGAASTASESHDAGHGSGAAGDGAATDTAPAGPADGGAQAGGTVAVTAVDFSFDLPSEELAAGEYTFELTNDGEGNHDLVVERDGEDVAATDPIGPGDTTTLTVTLEPGEYVFYCSVADHRSRGMEVPVSVS